MKKNNNHGKFAESGFSIVEMIVAMVIFMVVIGTVYGLLQVGLIDRNRSSRRSDVLKNARAAVHLIGRDTLNAGLSYNKSGALVPDDFISTHLGIPVDTDSERDTLTSIIGGNNLFFNILNSDPAVRTDLIAFAYRDSNFNAGNVISLKDAGAVSGAPETVRLQTTTAGATNTREFDMYLVESDSSQVAVMATGRPDLNQIDIAPGDPLNMNQPLNGTGTSASLLQKCTATVTENCTTYVASVKRFFWVAYRVKSDGTLVRLIFGNNTGAARNEQIQEMPIAYNIEDFQIRYVLEDGTTTDQPANFNLVRQITVVLKVQATENDEQLGVPETITLTSTFSTRNLEYDAG